MDTFTGYDDYDSTGMAELVRSGAVHPTELVEAAAARLEQVNPHINAVVYESLDQAREDAARGPHPGPFAGVPFLIKDLGAAYASGSSWA